MSIRFSSKLSRAALCSQPVMAQGRSGWPGRYPAGIRTKIRRRGEVKRDAQIVVLGADFLQRGEGWWRRGESNPRP